MTTTYEPSHQKRPILLFTDLDGTLLDHDSYSFDAARPALQRLAQLEAEVIPSTSKTYAEMSGIVEQLGLDTPFIIENGGAICYPQDYFRYCGETELYQGYEVLFTGPTYSNILKTIHQLRDEYGFKFRGFKDMDAEEVAADTGLPLENAVKARQRLCSEPLLWQDSNERLAEFIADLSQYGLRLVLGGRYWHAMGNVSKALAMQEMLACFTSAGLQQPLVIAAGDSPNDAEMLQAADIAIVVRRSDGRWLEVEGRQQTIRTELAGPAGWNQAVLQILDQQAQDE
ncbi:MAG: HAD-IIB family hydrolase [Chromatiales bacterium]|jgi:mannosyl-3-phosphoglycerate phosphatase